MNMEARCGFLGHIDAEAHADRCLFGAPSDERSIRNPQDRPGAGYPWPIVTSAASAASAPHLVPEASRCAQHQMSSFSDYN